MKMKFAPTVLTSVALAVLITGCAGYDRALMVTKTNVGLDIESTPPTAELTIARREIAIQPTFPDRPKTTSTPEMPLAEAQSHETETALPLLGSFGLQGKFFNPSISGNFAGGEAAVSLASEDNDQDGANNLTADPEEESAKASICLMNAPDDIRSPIKQLWHWVIGKSREEAESEPRPFYFATDTAYGLKVAWTGTGGPYPDTLKLGYNRKELASAPIFIYKGCEKTKIGTWKVKLPSFMATIDNASSLERFADSATKHIQFFATGRAATEFAKRKSVRKIAFQQMAPDAAALESK